MSTGKSKRKKLNVQIACGEGAGEAMLEVDVGAPIKVCSSHLPSKLTAVKKKGTEYITYEIRGLVMRQTTSSNENSLEVDSSMAVFVVQK